VMLVSFGLASVALGTMLGTFVRSESQANGASMMLGMSLALLGGCWYPLELFPQAARAAANLLPTAWAMQGLNNLVLHGQGLAGVLPQAGVLLGFATVFFAVGVWRFRYE
jgi:ABC-2 type transport system permease protein